MFGWFIRFIEKAFSLDLSAPAKPARVNSSVLQNGNKKVGKKEQVDIGGLIITRESLPNITFGSQFNSGAVSYLGQYRYWCPKCDTVLTEGPSGGCAVNAVCEKCKINYGCLPGYWGDE